MWISKRKWQQVSKKIEEIEKSIAEQEKKNEHEIIWCNKKNPQRTKKVIRGYRFNRGYRKVC